MTGPPALPWNQSVGDLFSRAGSWEGLMYQELLNNALLQDPAD